jgi:hypothetical protein
MPGPNLTGDGVINESLLGILLIAQTDGPVTRAVPSLCVCPHAME